MDEAHLKTYVGALAVFAASLATSWIYWYWLVLDSRFILGTVAFACFILLGAVFSVRVSEQTTIGTWDIGLVAATVVLGPTWAAVAALPYAIYMGNKSLLRTIYEISQNVTIVYLAGIVFSFVSEPLLIRDPITGGSITSDLESLATVLYGALIAGAALLGANGVIDGGLLKVKYNQGFHETWQENIQPYLLSDAINILTAGISVLALMAYGPPAAIVVVAGSIGSQILVYRSREQVREIRALRERVGSLEEALATSNMTFGTMMIEDLGRKDGYTHRHAAATAVYARDLARELKLDEARAGRLRMAGLLHNIGLFGLPEDLLLATGNLNSVAQNALAEHAGRGEEALASVPEFKDIASWVRWHHERPDGRGYPDKMRGPWIPLEAKILAVSQAYAAMVLDKPQHPGMSFTQARENLSAGADTEFDGVAVRAFLRILDTESEGYRMADDYRFVFPAPETEDHSNPEASSIVPEP